MGTSELSRCWRSRKWRDRRLQPEQLEAPPVVEGHPSEPGGDVREPGESQDRDGEVTQRCKRLRRAADADLGPVLVKGPVPDVVAAVLDVPVRTDVTGELFWRGLGRAQVGDVERRVGRLEVVTQVAALPVDLDELGWVRRSRSDSRRPRDQAVP